jgi:hypothetical protein
MAAEGNEWPSQTSDERKGLGVALGGEIRLNVCAYL